MARGTLLRSGILRPAGPGSRFSLLPRGRRYMSPHLSVAADQCRCCHEYDNDRGASKRVPGKAPSRLSS
jgi:hypothetical protein